MNYYTEAIEKALNECTQDEAYVDEDASQILYCPCIFDNWTLWNRTPAGETAFAPCPKRYLFDTKKFAHKECLADGTWFRHPISQKIWSNYTQCVDLDDFGVRQPLNILSITGYCISLLALSISVCIFYYFRSLRCIRITIHKNLFFSFIFNNCMWLLWYVILAEPDILVQNTPWCQTLHVVLQYSLVANYFWMFCEGLYLHTILVKAFVDKQSIMKWLYVIGWGIPAALTVIYAAARSSTLTDTYYCWMDASTFDLILIIPVCLSMLTNLIFLVNIVKVLVTKLRAVNSSDTDQTRKAVRATIILIPLLGLHFFVIPFRPENDASWAFFYEILSAVVTSFQGLGVALLFCFCNGEVITLIQKKIRSRFSGKGRHPSWVTTSTLVGSRGESIRQHSPRRKSSRRQGGTGCNNHICLADITPSNDKSFKRKTSKQKKRKLKESLGTSCAV